MFICENHDSIHVCQSLTFKNDPVPAHIYATLCIHISYSCNEIIMYLYILRILARSGHNYITITLVRFNSVKYANLINDG